MFLLNLVYDLKIINVENINISEFDKNFKNGLFYYKKLNFNL